MEWLQRHHHLCRRAIGIGDDVFLSIAVDGVRVHFGDDQRHIGVHAEQTGVVDDGAAGGGGDGGINLRRARAGGKQRDVPAGEIEMLDVLDLQFTARIAEIDNVAGRARTGDGGDVGNRKLAFGQDIEHFAPDIAGGAHDDDFVTHFTLLESAAPSLPLDSFQVFAVSTGSPSPPGRPSHCPGCGRYRAKAPPRATAAAPRRGFPSRWRSAPWPPER